MNTRYLGILLVGLHMTFAGVATALPSGACLHSDSSVERKAYLDLTNRVYSAIANGQSLNEVGTSTLNRLMSCADGGTPIHSLDAKTGVQMYIGQGVITAWRPNSKAPSGRERAGFYTAQGREMTEDEAFALSSGVELGHQTQ